MRAAGAGGAEPPLQPILVDVTGRGGSTLMMRLLASTPRIALELQPPYEHRYLTWLWRWARLIDRPYEPGRPGEPSDPGWGPGRVNAIGLDPADPLHGPPPWPLRRMLEVGERPISSEVFEDAWRRFSDHAREYTREQWGMPDAEVTYYAEKHQWTDPDGAGGVDRQLDARTIVLVRDPRDTYLSILAFDDMIPGSMGPDPGGEHYLESFIAQQRARLDWLEQRGGQGRLVVDYADLVLSLPREAERIGRWLDVELDAGSAARDRSLVSGHKTAASVEASVGRWREEMAPELAARFKRGLGDRLDRFGGRSRDARR